MLAANLTNKMEFEPLPLPNHMGSWEAPMPGAWEVTTGSGVPSWDRSLLGEEPKVGNFEALLSDYFLVYTCLTYWPNLGEPALSRIWCLQLLGGSKGEYFVFKSFDVWDLVREVAREVVETGLTIYAATADEVC